MHAAQHLHVHHHASQQAAHDAHIGQIDVDVGDARAAQAVQRQVQCLQVGFHALVAVDLGTELQRLARGAGAVRAGMDDGAAVAQAREALAVEQMGVDASHLLRGIGTQAHGAARQLVDELAGLQVQRLPCAGEQGFEVLQHGRHDQFIAIATCGIEQASTQFFDVPGLGRQDIGDVIRQDPSRHGKGGGC